jgi:hypothetical protein
MPTLSEYKETYQRLSGKASDAARNLAFAGIALIWIFKIDTPGSPKLPYDLIFPCGLFVLTLCSDFLQYIVGTIVWGSFHCYQEKKKYAEYGSKAVEEDPDIDSPWYFPWFQNIFFIIKIICVLISYVMILNYIYYLWIK